VLLPLGGNGSSGGAVALAGGCSSSCCYAPLSDVWVFGGGAWGNVSAQTGSPALPSARLYHSASRAAGAGAFFVFGGTDVLTGALNDLWTVTFSGGGGGSWSAAWVQVAAGAALPAARAGQSQSALPAASAGAPADGSFVIFGGEGEDATLADAWVFAPSGAAAGAFAAVPAAGAGPGQRTQHAALAVALPLPGAAAGVARALLVSGGSDGDGNDHDDVWLLPLDAKPPTWLKLGASGAGAGAWPSVRHGHAMWGAAAAAASAGAATTTLSFLIFGGQNCSVPDPVNFLADTWRFSVDINVAADGSVALAGGPGAFALVDAGTGPSPRALGGIVPQDAAAGAVIYASGFGGYAGGTDDRLYNDVWLTAA
jgi:hypothetical protein